MDKNIDINSSTQTTIPTSGSSSTYQVPGTLPMTWLIARRQMIEAIRTRQTIVMFAFSLALLIAMVFLTIKPMVDGKADPSIIGAFIAFYLAWVCLMNSQAAIGVAAGVFAGDKERGSLMPLLVTPASNVSLFAGKVLGAVLPALLYTVVGVISYFLILVLLFGSGVLSKVPVDLSGLVLLLSLAISILGAVLASLISSRVGTFQSAQTYSSIIITVLWLAAFGLVFLASSWGLWIFMLVVVLAYLLDLALIYIAAATWRREEVIARQ